MSTAVSAVSRPPYAPQAALSDTARLACCLGAAAIAFHQPLSDMARIGATSSSYHHVLLAPALAVMIAMRDRRARAIPASPDLSGVALFLAAALVAAAGAAGGVAVVSHVGAVLGLVGAATAAVGRRRMAAWSPALLMLAFAVPFGEFLLGPLQSATAVAVEIMVRAAGVAAHRDHLTISTPAGVFEIAPACAGLRFLTAAMMTAALAGALFLASWPKRALFLAAALVLAIIANWLRAAAVVALAVTTDRRLGVGADHLVLGWILYAGVIALLVCAAYRWRDAAPASAPTPATRPGDRRAVAALLAAAAVSSAYAAFADAAPRRGASLHEASLAVEGWRRIDAPFEWRASIAGADERRIEGYWSARHGAVLVDRAVFAFERDGAEMVGWTTRAADGEAWRAIGRESQAVALGASVRRLPVVLLANDAGERVWTASIYRIGDKTYIGAARAKAAATLLRLAGRRQPGAVVFIASARGPAELAAFIESIALDATDAEAPR